MTHLRKRLLRAAAAVVGLVFAGMVMSPLSADAADPTVPKPYKKKHGEWFVDCSACDEDEEVLSHCWMTPTKGGLTVYPGRADLGQTGDLKWLPPGPETEEVVQPKGNLSFTVDDKPAITIEEKKTFFAAMNGTFWVSGYKDAHHYDAILSALKQGRSVTIAIEGPEDPKNPSPSESISLEGFNAALEDLGVQAPKYPEKAVCE
jgi:invasion protein IalB